MGTGVLSGALLPLLVCVATSNAGQGSPAPGQRAPSDLSVAVHLGPIASEFRHFAGETAYHDRSRGDWVGISGAVQLRPENRLTADLSLGAARDVAALESAPMAEPGGGFTRLTLIWHRSLTAGGRMEITGGLGYVTDQARFGWRHENRQWEWRRSLRALAGQIAGSVTAGGRSTLSFRFTYAPWGSWDESTRAVDVGKNTWEEWRPATLPAAATAYEGEWQYQIRPAWRVAAGLAGFSVGSPSRNQHVQTYTSSAGGSRTYAVTRIPAAREISFMSYVGISAQFW